MNFARIRNSKRLQRVFKLLASKKAYSTLEIIKKAKVCAVSSIISELRRNNIQIVCYRDGLVYKYRKS